jgi:SAM-dependent methyltransferase
MAVAQSARTGDRPLSFVDCGSGDGGVTLLAYKLGMKAVGVELDAELVAQAVASLAELPAGVEADADGPSCTFVTQSIFDHDLRGYDILFWHMLPDVLLRHAVIADRVSDALQHGAVLVAYRWAVARFSDLLVYGTTEESGHQFFIYHASATAAPARRLESRAAREPPAE